MSEAMREALEIAKDYISLKTMGEANCGGAEVIKQIDDALKVEPESAMSDKCYSAQDLLDVEKVAYQKGLDKWTAIPRYLLELPDKIKAQTQRIVGLTNDGLNLEKELELAELGAKELVYNSVEGKAQYTNDTARKAAKEKLLASDLKYQELLKIRETLNMKKQVEQIELEYLHNIFKAYLAIAGMGK